MSFFHDRVVALTLKDQLARGTDIVRCGCRSRVKGNDGYGEGGDVRLHNVSVIFEIGFTKDARARIRSKGDVDYCQLKHIDHGVSGTQSHGTNRIQTFKPAIYLYPRWFYSVATV